MSQSDWSVSGLCVTVLPENLLEVSADVERMPGFEVHARDEETGKLVVVQERTTLEEHRCGLRQLQEMPRVLTAELVLHYNDINDDPKARTAGGTA